MRSIDEIRELNGTLDAWVHRPIIGIGNNYFYEEPDGSLTPCNWDDEKEDSAEIASSSQTLYAESMTSKET